MFIQIYRLFNLFMAALTGALMYMYAFEGVFPPKIMILLWGATFVLDTVLVIWSTYSMNKEK